MHRKMTGIKGLILILAGLVVLAAAALTPSFGGGTTNAGPGSGINLNRSAFLASFIIPGVPVTTLASAVLSSQQPQFVLTITGNATELFPKSGELLIGKTELVVYDQNKGCATNKNEICVTARAKVGIKKNHAPGDLVQLATQLTAPVNVTTDAVQCNLASAITATAQAGGGTLLVTCDTPTAAFGAAGNITIAHSGTVLNLSSEFLEYANPGPCAPAPSANQLCITARAQQPGNDKRAHLADGFTQPCTDNNALTCSPQGKTQGRSVVTKHFQMTVKSNAGFFPTGPLVVYEVDGSNIIGAGEIINYNNAADKIKTPPATEFHATTRGGFMASLQPTTVAAHAAGSIVTGAHAQLVCRNGTVQPGVDTDLTTGGVQEPDASVPNGPQLAGTSVAVYPVCYTRTQPDDQPKTVVPKKLAVPIIGSTLIVLNAVGVPFLSSGGLVTSILGPVPLVDNNGTDDGTLDLISPCIENFTPGTNLKVTVSLDTSDNDATTPDVGSIEVVLDTIPDPVATSHEVPTHELCDDAAGTGVLVSSTYSYYNGTLPEDGALANTCSDTLDNGPDGRADILDADCYSLANGAITHDTDGDGCSDLEELNPNIAKGGLRDPWNPRDYYDINGDGDIDVPNDILQVILAYLQTSTVGAQYTVDKDRGGAFGPFAHNRGDADDVIDVPNDILPVILQYLNNCKDGP